MKGYIYSLTDPRDNQIRYIGQTRFSLNKRFKEHMRNCKYNITKNHNVYRWINELRDINLLPIIKIVEEIDNDLLNEREKYWVSYYGNNLKNMTQGGDGIKFITIKSFSAEHRKKIGDSCRGNKHYNYGKSAHNIRPIYQFDLINGCLLKEYESIKEAVQETGILQPSISFCLTGKRNCGGNYIWIYKNVYDADNSIIDEKLKKVREHPSNQNRSKPVVKIDINSNKIITIYDSIKEAARKNNTSDTAIHFACEKSKTHEHKNFK